MVKSTVSLKSKDILDLDSMTVDEMELVLKQRRK